MSFIEQLKERLQTTLPGIEAQMKMAPPIRTRDMQASAHARLGGVLVLLIEGDRAWNTILIRRTEDGQTHSGQISFPGGKKELNDPDIIATALRECEEEIGVNKDHIEVLGTLTPLYIPPSNFLVTPTIGYIQHVQSFKPSEREVQEIIKVPLDLLFNPSVKDTHVVRRSDRNEEVMKTPVYKLNDEMVIWGATAMMISELENLLA
jgi:8-oxo-dGTP pyrophosphatase MutT (NUDIX family)